MSSAVGVRGVVVAVAALLALPAVAAAAPPDLRGALPPELRPLMRPGAHRPGSESASVPRFDFETGNGYTVAVTGLGPDVVIGVSQRHSPATTTYMARGVVSPTRLEASFGDLGRIAVRFRPSGRVVRTQSRPHCKGPDRFTSRLGVFVGDVRFSGEGGYTSADIHRVKGRVSSPPSLRCAASVFKHERGGGNPIGSPKHRLRLTLLNAAWKTALSSATFVAAAGFGDTVLFSASSEQSEGSVAIVRRAVAIASARTFAFDNTLTFAGVTPPAPFSGTGSFQASPDGVKSWTGSLAVSFPGAENMPLSGPQFKAALLRSF
jgi:hypothetical protein